MGFIEEKNKSQKALKRFIRMAFSKMWWDKKLKISFFSFLTFITNNYHGRKEKVVFIRWICINF
jgi:hypothetical protein